MTKYRAISPFLCMDMTYITCLLKEGFGFKDSTVLQVSASPDSPPRLPCASPEAPRLTNLLRPSVRPSVCLSDRQLAKKVNNVETSWALGATFDYFRNLNIH